MASFILPVSVAVAGLVYIYWNELNIYYYESKIKRNKRRANR